MIKNMDLEYITMRAGFTMGLGLRENEKEREVWSCKMEQSSREVSRAINLWKDL